MHHLTTRTLPIASLVPADYNPRTISDAALGGLRSSVERFGLVEPIVWNDRTGRVVGGHQRLRVLQQLGEEETTVVVVDLDETDEKALNVALNNPSIAGEFTPRLHELLAELRDAAPELHKALRLDELAADTRDLLALLDKRDGETAPDDTPELPAEPVTRAGDLIELGKHRLICGDATDPVVLNELMDGQVARLYATDPPYGVDYDGTDGKRGQDSWDHFAGDGALLKFLTDAFQAATPYVATDAAWYCWHASSKVEEFREAWRQTGVRVHQVVEWVKPHHTFGRSVWNYRAEPCLVGWRPTHKPPVNASPDEQSNVWEVDWEGKARHNGLHPTQKPVRVFELPIQRHTRPGDVCLETFAGSGSQVIAAERTGRRCFAVERCPRFCDVIVQRWEEYTGNRALRPRIKTT